MYSLPRHSYLRRSVISKHHNELLLSRTGSYANHKERLKHQLKQLGITWAGLRSMEAKHLPHVIHTNEVIGGAVYGRHEYGLAMMVATDRRIIFLDCKPMFTNEDEINYYVVSGISNGNSGLISSITLHTRVKDYKLRTFSPKSVNLFAEFIETRCLEHEDPAGERSATFN